MFRSRLVFCGLGPAAAWLLLLTPSISEAQVRWGVGISRGGVGVGVGNAPIYGYGYRGYGYPGYGYPGFGYRGYGYPYYGYRGYGYPGYYGRSGVSIGIGIGLGGYGYYPGYAYSGYYTPFVAVPRYYTTDPYYSAGYPSYSVQPGAAYTNAPARVNNAATMDIRVPADAKVLFDGAATTQTGTDRRFVSPELTPGYDYTYTISASWMEGGKEVTQERQIVVQAGQYYRIDMTGEALSTPKKAQP
jgi:uncharacterized protein (TIGR03000 family)